MNCGKDLARVRVQRDPHYHLPLVICPQCGTAAVRQRHPIIARYRQSRLIVLAMVGVLVQLASIGLFGFLNLMATVAVMMIMLEVPRYRNEDEVRVVLVMSLLALPIATGTWLTVAFHHLRRWKVWLGWMLIMLLPIGILGCALAATEEFTVGDPTLLAQFGWSTTAIIVASTMLFTIVALAPLSVMMIVALLGVFPGRGLVWVHDVTCRGLWRARLRRVRRWRSA